MYTSPVTPLSLRLLLLAAMLASFRETPASESTTPNNRLDEVTVTAPRAHLNALRSEITRLEDRFYARYNQLNRNRDFDVHCRREAPTGTRLEFRVCRATYEELALHDEGRQALQIMQRLREYRGGARDIVMDSPPAPAILAIEAQRPAFQRNMQDVVSHDPELSRLLRERAAAIERYDTARRHGGGPSGGAADAPK